MVEMERECATQFALTRSSTPKNDLRPLPAATQKANRLFSHTKINFYDTFGAALSDRRCHPIALSLTAMDARQLSGRAVQIDGGILKIGEICTKNIFD
jgi:hypothetical protein